MIQWGPLQDGLVALTKSLTGLTNVRWSGTTATFVAAETFAEAELQAFTVKSVGQLDALTWGEVAPNGPLVQTSHGMREFTLRTKVTVYDQRPDLVARAYLEQMRDRMAWDSTRDELKALNLGFQTALSPVDLSVPRDKHIASIAALDVRFNLSTSDTDDAHPVERIESGTFTLNGDDV